MRRQLIAVLVSAALAAGGISSAPMAAPAPAQQGGWSFERTGFAPDPAITFGTLPNGMRYAVRRSDNPPGQVAMRLVIAAGSQNEGPGQEGLAHMLEHLAFRGSAKVPDGEMVRTLERLGLRLGADTNAYTGSDTTGYRFDLAKSDTESVDTGLMLLRQIAGDLTLSPAALDSERNVVLAEERTRAGPSLEASKALIRSRIGDHPAARSPIGEVEVIRTAPIERVRAFYNAYYRPERATVVVAGDIDPAQIVSKIQAVFGDWRGRGSPGGDPGPAQVARESAPRVFQTVTPGLSSNQLEIEWLQPWRPHRYDRAEAVDAIIDQVAVSIVRQRIRDNPVSQTLFSISNGVRRNDMTGVIRGVMTDAFSVKDLPAAIDFLVKTRKQAVEYGVSQEEIDFVVNAGLTSMRREVSTGGLIAMNTLSHASMLADAGRYNYSPQSPAQRLALYEEVTRGLTVNRVNAALRELYGEGSPVIRYTGPARVAEDAAVLAAYSAAAAAPVSRYAVIAAKPWSYTNFGPAGTVAERRDIAELGVSFVTFTNGVKLTVKPMSVDKERVLVQTRFGAGRIGMPRDRLDSSDMASSMLNMGGLSDLTNAERTKAMAGRQALALVTTGEDAYVVSNNFGGLGAASLQDLDLQMQIIAAQFAAPGWRSDEWATQMASSDSFDGAMDASASAVFSKVGPLMLHSGDTRWKPNTKEDRAKMTPDLARAFIEPILRDSRLEVVMVGDLTVEQAIAATAKTLGALPPRPGVAEPPGARQVRLPAATPTPLVEYHGGRADDARLVVTWPATDLLSDLRGAAALQILTRIFNDRAIERLRNTEGKTYNPSVGPDQSAYFPGYGRIAAGVTAPPAEMDNMLAGLDALAADLAANPVSADELLRARNPAVEAARRSEQQTAYWQNWLGGAQGDPRRLDYLRTYPAALEAVTAADVQAAARRWLVKERSWRMKIIPRALAQAGPP